MKEASLEETAAAALAQIRDKNYDAALAARGFEKEQIRHYGFAFEGKQVLIGQAMENYVTITTENGKNAGYSKIKRRQHGKDNFNRGTEL